jgi:hypothetical protein
LSASWERRRLCGPMGGQLIIRREWARRNGGSDLEQRGSTLRNPAAIQPAFRHAGA